VVETAGRLLDPAVQGRSTRRRWMRVWLLIGLAVLAIPAAVLIVHAERSAAPAATPPAPQVTTTTVPGNPALAVGALVRASQLYSDPVFVDASDGYALARGTGGAANERLATSSNGGSSWHVAGAPFPVAGTFTTLLFTDALHGYVFGPAGLIVTSDGGEQWTQAPLTGQVVRVLPAYGTVWAVGLACKAAPGLASNCPVTVAISHDNGKTWSYTRQDPPVGEGPNGGAGLGLVTASNAYVVTWGAASSGLAVTVDSGDTWTRLDDPCAVGWSIVDLVPLIDGDMWLICGGTPAAGGEVKSVYRTQDGGSQWTLASSTGLAPGDDVPVGSIPYSGLVSQLATVDPLIAWLGVGGVGVLETLDGGRLWFVADGITGAGTADDVGVTFIRSPDGAIDDGWALGFGVALWRTTDAVHWRLEAQG
jgi:hypothetical protein